MDQRKIELWKSLLTLASGSILLALGWLIGQRITYTWGIRQKRREGQLFSLQQFYLAYGEFFAIWKLWNRLEPDTTRIEKQWELHKRAAAAEASVEALLVKVASELTLTSDQIKYLGSYRQAFQQLRQAIRRGEILGWGSSETSEYKAFKTLAVAVSSLLGKEWNMKPPSSDCAARQLLDITSNWWETRWVITTKRSRFEDDD